MEEIEVSQFCNIIEDEGCLPSHLIEIDGKQIRYYLSWNKTRRVPICISEDFFSARVAAALFVQLEVEDLIERLKLKI